MQGSDQNGSFENKNGKTDAVLGSLHELVFPEINEKEAKRSLAVKALLGEVDQAVAEARFVPALGAFREAINLARSINSLQDLVIEAGVRQTGLLARRRWQVASSFLAELLELAPNCVPSSLVEEVRQAERLSLVKNLLDEFDATHSAADTTELRLRLAQAVQQYPEEPALESRLAVLNATATTGRQETNCHHGYAEFADLVRDFESLEDSDLVTTFAERSAIIAQKYPADSALLLLLNEISSDVNRYQQAAKALIDSRIQECLQECSAVLSRRPKHCLFLRLKRAAEDREIFLSEDYIAGVAHLKRLLALGEIHKAELALAKLEAKFPQFAGLDELKAEIDDWRENASHSGRKLVSAPQAEIQPQSDSLGDSEPQRRERARKHLRHAESCLLNGDVAEAEKSFTAASDLFPHDHSLADFIVGPLDQYARRVFDQNWQEADKTFAIAKRFQPAYVIPGDLAVLLRQKREQVERDRKRLESLKEIADIQAAIEAAPEPRVATLKTRLQQIESTGSSDRVIREAATSTLAKVDQIAEKSAHQQHPARPIPVQYKTRENVIPPSAPPSPSSLSFVLRLSGVGLALVAAAAIFWHSHSQVTKPLNTSVAIAKPAAVPLPLAVAANGILVVHSNVPDSDIFINGQKYHGPLSAAPIAIELAADSYQVRSAHVGYNDFGPLKISIGRGAKTNLDVTLTPRPSFIEVPAIQPGTLVKIDGQPVNAPETYKVLRLQVPVGSHRVELSRGGFVTKRLTRNLAPGSIITLTREDLALESTDAATLVFESQYWKRAATSNNQADFESYLAKYPLGLHAGAARAELDRISWARVDRKDPAALKAFLTNHASGQYSHLAQDQLQKLDNMAEQNEWSLLDKSSKTALQSFLTRRPSSIHAAEAQSLLSKLGKQAEQAEARRLEEMAWASVNSHDQHSLEDYVARFPSGIHRSEAEESIARFPDPSANADATAIQALLERFENAWNAKNVRALAALELNLDKRAVKAQLAEVREISVKIAPVSPPVIDGSHATIMCRRQAHQVFNDGSERHTPEALVIYILDKRNGTWFVEGAR